MYMQIKWFLKGMVAQLYFDIISIISIILTYTGTILTNTVYTKQAMQLKLDRNSIILEYHSA